MIFLGVHVANHRAADSIVCAFLPFSAPGIGVAGSHDTTASTLRFIELLRPRLMDATSNSGR